MEQHIAEDVDAEEDVDVAGGTKLRVSQLEALQVLPPSIKGNG